MQAYVTSDRAQDRDQQQRSQVIAVALSRAMTELLEHIETDDTNLEEMELLLFNVANRKGFDRNILQRTFTMQAHLWTWVLYSPSALTFCIGNSL